MENKPINLLIEDTKKEIIDVVNKSGLPISIINFILKEVYTEAENQLRQVVEQEKRQFEESRNEGYPNSTEIKDC